MYPVTLLLLSAALYIPLSGLAAETEQAAPTAETEQAASTLTTTLEQLGYPNGLTFDGSSQPSERTLLFHLPKEMAVKSATLRIVYRGSPRLGRGAALRATINDLPPQRMELAADDKETHTWQLRVPQSNLGSGQLKVTLSSYLPVDYGHLVDGEPQSGFVHVAAATHLVSEFEGAALSLRDAWLTLPEEVVVSVPRGTLSETSFRAALAWVTLLQRNQHRVRITTLPDLGNLVIAPESDILAALAYLNGQAIATQSLWNNKKANLGLVKFGGKTFIAVTAPYADVARFAASWQGLSQHAYLETDPLALPAANVETVPLDTRGLSTASARLGHKLQWSATITPWNVPPGMRPSSATLYLVSPKTEPQETFRFYIYLNDKMVVSTRFAGDGATREMVVPFNAVPPADAYQLRVVVRDGGEHRSTRPARSYLFQITSRSYATIERAPVTTEGFSSLPASLGHGFDLYVPRDYLAAAPRYLARISQLMAGFVVPSTPYKLIILEPGRIPAPNRNFIIAGDAPPQGATLPLRFDQGRVQLVNYRGERLIEERRLRSASVVQLIDADGARGLWFHPGELDGLPAIDTNLLGSDDVAVYEPDQLALSINSQQRDLARPQYLEKPSWSERLYGRRVMWLQIGWGLLTLAILYLHFKSRQHRRG